jgi:hypothetical protein
MSATTQHNVVAATRFEKQAAPTTQRLSWFARQAEKFETGRFGWMALFITIQTCLGSAACMYILQNEANVVMLSVCTALTMACNAVMIAQGPPKLCLAVFYLSILMNSFFVIYNII